MQHVSTPLCLLSFTVLLTVLSNSTATNPITELEGELNKRGWANFQGGYGKRGWTNFQGGYGKRGWNNFGGGSYGKRSSSLDDDDNAMEEALAYEIAALKKMESSPIPPSTMVLKRAWNNGFTGGMGKRAWNNGFTGGMGKRAWNSGFGPGMGKRAWNSGFAGGMGKRAWNSGFAGGMGKRSSTSAAADNDAQEDFQNRYNDDAGSRQQL